MQKFGTLPMAGKFRCSSDPDILLTVLHCKDYVSFSNELIAIDIQRSEKIHVKTKCYNCLQRMVAKLAELR